MLLQDVPPQYCGICCYRLIAPTSVTTALEASLFQQTVKTIFLYGSSIVNIKGKSSSQTVAKTVEAQFSVKYCCVLKSGFMQTKQIWILQSNHLLVHQFSIQCSLIQPFRHNETVPQSSSSVLKTTQTDIALCLLQRFLNLMIDLYTNYFSQET